MEKFISVEFASGGILLDDGFPLEKRKVSCFM